MRNRLCLSAALVTAVAGVATLSQEALGQAYTVNLTSIPVSSSLPNIGQSTTVTTSGLLLGGVGPSDLSIAAWNMQVLTGNASITNILGQGAFALLPPPNAGDVVLFANPAVPGPGPLLLSSHLITRTGPGDIMVGFTPVPGIPMQGTNCANAFIGGGYTITVPSPSVAGAFGMAALFGFGRRRR